MSRRNLIMQKDTVATRKGILPPTYFFAFLVLAIGLHLAYPVLQIIHWPHNLIGLVPLSIGAWITIWADRMFKRRGTTVKPHLDPSELITTGPYRFSRHPMYLGMVLISTGIVIIFGSITPFLTPVVLTIVFQVEFIPLEEKTMERLFGQQYCSYRQQVRPWL